MVCASIQIVEPFAKSTLNFFTIEGFRDEIYRFGISGNVANDFSAQIMGNGNPRNQCIRVSHFVMDFIPHPTPKIRHFN